MDRLTEYRKDLKRYEYKQDEKGYCYIGEGQIVNKLGELEDLLQSYNVKDLKELDKLLEMATTYEELSKQLGCPLDFIFKVLQAPKIYIDKMNVRSEYDNSFKFHSKSNNYIINPYAIDGKKPEFLFVDRWSSGYDLRLKDYKKTWFLKEDRSE